ncbi:hypothetical protein [Nocardia farcinica]|uniref:hypothetical protein n=1 Tax=Nocardia farcinica TaxID=37329 RepID=UPI0024568F92|nr:hypothetical protein [Nocardia farcinica]
MPLATATDVQRGWLELDADQRLDAEQLIAAAEQWIRARRPDMPDDDPLGKRVVIEVVRAALAPPAEFTGHTRYVDAMGPFRQEGELETPAGTLVFTAAHAQLLGISTGPVPRWNFGDCPA